MPKLTLNNVASFTNDTTAVSTTTANNDAIEAAMEKTLSRDGTAPNTMTADIDMNSNDLLNVDNINTVTLSVGGISVTAQVASAAASATAAASSATSAASSASSASASASTATTQASNASTSATNAATSATNAASSATTATTQASNASTSATNAATSATNAASSATTASTQATNAATSATDAAASATSAAAHNIAFKYLFDSSTTMADPGTGDLRLNHATIASVTAIALSNTFSGGSDISDYIITWDDSTHTPKSLLSIRKSGDADLFIIYNITAVTDNGAWLQLTVTHNSSGGGTLSASDALYIGNQASGHDGTGVGDLLAANNLSDVASAATSATNLGLGTLSSPQHAAVNIGHATDTTITRVSAGVLAVEGNTIYAAGGTDVPVADGGTGASTAAGARTNLGLDTMATQAASAVAITGGTVTGITDLTIADGGTGASTAQAAIDALSAVSAATNEHVLTKDTASGNAIFKAVPLSAATQAEQEAASSITVAATPGRQHFHPSAAKCWGFATGGGTPSLGSPSYNVTSIADTGVGRMTVTIGTDFSTTSYVVLNTVNGVTGAGMVGTSVSKAAGTVELNSANPIDCVLTDPTTGYDWTMFGDQ